jgi:predicted transcriptional regulator
MDIHHGETIEKVVRRNGHSITDVAKLTKVNRRSVYNWFNQPKLKPEIIYKIGCVINHDFSVELPQLFTSEDFAKGFKEYAPAMQEEQEADIEIWKDKYIGLMERYTALLAECNMDREINSLLNTVK